MRSRSSLPSREDKRQRMKISVQTEDFDLGLEVLDIQQDNRIGAVASFVGQVREVPMTLEHYPGMTENAIKKIVEEARGRWQVMDYTVHHPDGAHWVDARESDDEAAERWRGLKQQARRLKP